MIASILFWKVVFSTVIFDITSDWKIGHFENSFNGIFTIEMLPRIAAKMRTPTRKSPVTKRSSVLLVGSGWGVSPMVVRVRVDQ